MKSKESYAVFGLGRYGLAVAKELLENGKEVIAIDINQKVVNEVATFIPICKCADVTDLEVLSRLGIANIDTVIVCMANNLEASVMAVTLCKELGVKTIVAKCANEVHQKILLRVGADKVVFPEYESGVRLAKNLITSGVVDIITLSKDFSMVEIDVKEEWVGKNLIELNLRKKYGINVVAVKRGEVVSVEVNPEELLEKELTLIVIANTSKIDKIN